MINLSESVVPRAVGEQRRRIRHVPHTPAYASFRRPNTGLSLDLSELLDVNEDGFSVRTNEALELNRNVNFNLDLPETKALLHCTGRVIWGDAGRYGIRFSSLAPDSQRQLKNWILVNLLIAAARHAAQKKAASKPERTAVEGPHLVSETHTPPVSDLSGMLFAVEAVRREVHAAADLDAALNLVTERALSLTGASGAALALNTDGLMICRARAGEPAPPLGTVVDVKQGLSGECVRTGRMVVCEDVETDRRVDREICREMGIGSILASPIVSDFRVIGLLEVFSPNPQAFAEVHETALDRLSEIVPKAQAERRPLLSTASSAIALANTKADPISDASIEQSWESDSLAQESLKGIPVRYFHIALLLLTFGMVSLAAGYILAPTIQRFWLKRSANPASALPAVRAAELPAPSTRPKTLAEITALAERGDAEAQWNLGTRYRNGEGVIQDDTQAVRWFLRAAEQGNLNAQSAAAASYWAGRGVPRDLSRAYYWSVLAANQGDDTSESRLQGLALQMTRSEVAQAQAQADEWLRRHGSAK